MGKSLAPFLSGRRVKSWRDDFFYEHTFLGTPRLPKTAGVVKTDWKYIMYTEHGYEEFYDLRSDPHETRNLADDPEYSKKTGSVSKALSRLFEAGQRLAANRRCKTCHFICTARK